MNRKEFIAVLIGALIMIIPFLLDLDLLTEIRNEVRLFFPEAEILATYAAIKLT